MTTEHADRARMPLVGIGASAGGLQALKRFFETVPDDLGAAYVVVVHLAPDHDSELDAILAHHTKMPVVQVGDHRHEPLRPDCVYVIAPDRKLEITDTAVGASPFEQPRGQRAAIDLFFRSLAAAPGRIFAVVLSGGGSDGAAGAEQVKEAGGLVLVQDPAQALHESMPGSVIARGAADVVLPVAELAQRLARLIRDGDAVAPLATVPTHEPQVEQAQAAALARVLDLLRRRTGHDFSKYKRTTVLRRLLRRIQLHHLHSIADYLDYLQEHAEEVQHLLDDFLITVTSFFRDPDAWQALQERVIGPLVEDADPDEPIRCWVAGCASGEEAYTLAMLIAEEIERRKIDREFTIFASDVDERALAVARQGRYPLSIGADVSDARLKRWLERVDQHYIVVRELRDHLVFAQHSVQRDPPFSQLDLVSCRNLLIYLDHELQDQLMGIFRYACRDGGYLFLGTSETAGTAYFRSVDKKHCIYQTVDNADVRRRLLPDLPVGSPRPPPARAATPTPPARNLAAEAHQAALEAYAPPSILVDSNWETLHLSALAGRYLQPRGGPASQAIVELVRPELRGELTVALRHAFESKEQWLSAFVPVRFNGTPRRVGVLVAPRAGAQERPERALVTFLEAGELGAADDAEQQCQPGNDRERLLLEKLHQAERHIEHLQSEHNGTEEDLRAANEELQSLNEEYRSTTEELETSKEELQSINEELQTVNLQLKTKLEEVSRAHDDLENLMAATDIATLFLDRSLCIKRFTPALAAIFKVKSHDQGRSIGDITHCLEYDQLEQDAQQVLSGLVPIEHQVHATDGRCFIIRLRPYRTAEDKIDGVVLTLVDITGLKRAEAVLSESEERFRALVAASAQIVWTTDAEGKVQEDAPSWRAYTGQSLEQFLSDGWLDAVHPDDRSAVEDQWRHAVASTIPLDTEYRLYHGPTGGYRWTSVRAVPLLHGDGSVRGWVAMNIDVTERKEAEMALRQADQHKDEFLAMLSHELRNPLAAICNSIELLKDSAETDTGLATEAIVERVIPLLDRQSRHMARLVNDLLDVTRIARNKLELRRQPTDVCRCVREAVETVQPQLDAAGLELRLQLPEQPLRVNADPDRLLQVVDNLLRNAIGYTDPGGQITLAAVQEGEQTVIRVRDTGIGIAPEELGLLFQAFQQTAKGRDTSGLGLGLALVKQLVELHGGVVTAASAGPGQGSEFVVRLPMVPEDHADAAAAQPAASPGDPPRRLLVVEDNVDLAETTRMLLEGIGHVVETAYDGPAALEGVERFQPAVVLLDLGLPGMDGVEVARRIRQIQGGEGPRLVALTGRHQDDTERRELAAVFDDHLTKPVNLATLQQTLARVGVRC